jgi:hypothetical protein
MRETSWNWRAKLDNDQSWLSKTAYLLEKEAQHNFVGVARQTQKTFCPMKVLAGMKQPWDFLRDNLMMMIMWMLNAKKEAAHHPE